MSDKLDVDDVELNDFFDDEADDAEVSETEEKEVEAEKPAETDDSKEDDTKDAEDSSSSTNENNSEGELDGESEKPQETTNKTVPLAALKEERRLRQEAQQEADKLRNQIPHEVDPSEPDPLDDTEVWKDWNRNQVRAEIQADQNKAFADKVEESRIAAIEKYGEEYDKAEEIFSVLAQQNPELGKQLFESSNPAEFAYEKGMEFINKQESELEVKIRAKILAEMTKTDGTTDDNVTILPQLASATGSGANKVEVEIDNDDFDEIFGDQKY